jgi:hypothetical protein
MIFFHDLLHVLWLVIKWYLIVMGAVATFEMVERRTGRLPNGQLLSNLLQTKVLGNQK